jgi:hypothetical protein
MSNEYTYDVWMESQGIPIHRGYYIEDLRTVEVAPWSLRGCDAAFVQLEGMQGVVESRVQEIAPGASLPPFKAAMDEVVYVLSGQGSASVWGKNANNKHNFEWSARSMFVLPRNTWAQLSNMQGDRVVRLLHYNYLPLGMSAVSDPDFFFDNPYEEELVLASAEEMYSEAQAITQDHIGEGQARRTLWVGNFFPDMGVWDKLMFRPGRGSMNRSVYMEPPSGELSMHMSVFASGTYKKGHRHGPGRVIVIPGGEGYSIMWPHEGAEKQVIPWHEASCFVPPDRWFHQHFNAGEIPGRYLALHPPRQFAGGSETVEDIGRDQIEYVNEDPAVRERFESELDKRGLKSAMPPQAYDDPDYVWSYDGYESH